MTTSSHLPTKPSWLLEYNHDDEMYTEENPSEELIIAHLDAFDGKSAFYCALSDSEDECILYCYGEPDRRVLEARLPESGAGAQRVLSHGSAGGAALVHVRVGRGATEIFAIPENQLFTRQQCIDIFRLWFLEKRVPEGLIRLSGGYLFVGIDSPK